ncbi:unnamed protein product, partial [Laminaria digitata]
CSHYCFVFRLKSRNHRAIVVMVLENSSGSGVKSTTGSVVHNLIARIDRRFMLFLPNIVCVKCPHTLPTRCSSKSPRRRARERQLPGVAYSPPPLALPPAAALQPGRGHR